MVEGIRVDRCVYIVSNRCFVLTCVQPAASGKSTLRPIASYRVLIAYMCPFNVSSLLFPPWELGIAVRGDACRRADARMPASFSAFSLGPDSQFLAAHPPLPYGLLP